MVFFRALVLLSLGLWVTYCPIKAQSVDSVWRYVNLEDVVVTAQYAPTDSRNALYRVQILKKEEIQRQGQYNLADLLSNQLNMQVNPDPILGSGLQMQGIGGQNIQIMIDGVPVIGRLGGNIDLSQINLADIERVEIIEGAMSAQYGSNASGGVINLISKKSQLEGFRVESQNQYETVGIWNNALSLGASLEKLYVGLTGSRAEFQFEDEEALREYETNETADGNTFRTRVNPWNPKLQYGLNGTLAYRFSDSLKATYQYRHFDETLQIYGERRRPQFEPYAFDETFVTKRQDHNLQLEGYLNKTIYLNTSTAFNTFHRRNWMERLEFESGSRRQLNGSQDTTEFTGLLHRTSLSTTKDSRLNGTLGLEYLHETGAGDRIIDSTSNPVNTSQLTNYAIWLGSLYDFGGGLEAAANVRIGYNSRFDHPVVPSAHLKYQPNQNWRLRFSAARGFRAPSLKELYNSFIDVNHFIVGNSSLKPEKSLNFSISVEHDLLSASSHTLTSEVVLFYNSIEDRIVLAEFEPARFNYQNLDRFKTNGINLGLEYRNPSGLKLKGGMAYTRLFNNLSETYDTDTYTGLFELQSELLVPFWTLDFNLTHHYFGRQLRYFENAEGQLAEGFIGAYHLLNASLSRTFWEQRIFLSLGAKNILNTESIPVSGQVGGGAHASSNNSRLIGWGRSFFIKVDLRFVD